jgi:polysaccharide export outer membrane protein
MSACARLVAAILGACAVVAAPAASLAQSAAGPGPVVRGSSPAASAPAATAASAGADQTYILGPADVIEVSIPGRTDFTTRGRISETGSIELPFLGAVTAQGRTSTALADEISRALDKGGFFTHPIISVEIVSYASKYVTVLGQVANPGLVPVDRPYHLSEILARVGGVKESGADYVVLRPDKGAERRLPVETLATGDSSEDPYVSPGDKIYSPRADLFYVTGQVTAPGAFALVPDMTVAMAVARAGGVNAEGSLGKIQITRKGVKRPQRDLNAKVEPGDVIFIGERLF